MMPRKGNRRRLVIGIISKNSAIFDDENEFYIDQYVRDNVWHTISEKIKKSNKLKLKS